MAGEMFAYMTGIKVVHVPYRGGPQALTAVMTGEVGFDFPGLPVGLRFSSAGKVRAIAERRMFVHGMASRGSPSGAV